MKKSLWLPLAAGALLVTGCGTKPDVANTGSADSGSKTTVAATGKTPVAPSDPKEVVRLFLDSMRQGNANQLSILLSTLAREEIKNKQLEIAPLGSPEATFMILEAAQDGEAMFVESSWTEPAQAGQPGTELEVVWELRKEPAGWRICGMAVDPKNGEEIQLVDFEKLEPEQPAAQDPQRVASLPNAPVGQNNQPAFNAQQPAGSVPPAGNYQPAANNLPGGNFPPAGNYNAAPGTPLNQPSVSNQPAGGLPQAGNFGGANQLPPIVSGNSSLPPSNPQPGSSQLRR